MIFWMPITARHNVAELWIFTELVYQGYDLQGVFHGERSIWLTEVILHINNKEYSLVTFGRILVFNLHFILFNF